MPVADQFHQGRVTLAPGFGDGTYQGRMNINDGSVRIISASGEFTNVPVDTTVFHTYSILCVDATTTVLNRWHGVRWRLNPSG